jgi:hypothetical protein
MGAIRAAAAAVLMFLGMAASAADCVSGVRLLSTRASVPNLVAGRAAWSGTVLAVTKTNAANRNEIWLGVYDEQMNTLVEDRRLVTNATSINGIVDLIWNGTEFGLFYRTADNLIFQRLTTFGNPAADPVIVNPGRRPRPVDDIDVVWSDALDSWVVARHIGTGPQRGLYVSILDEDGTQTYDTEIAAAPPSNPELEVAVTDTGAIGVFHLTTDEPAMLFTRVFPDDFPDTRTIVAIGGTDVDVVTAGDLFVVTRRADGNIRWFIADSDFQLVRPDGILVAGANAIPLGLAANDTELALTYSVPPAGPSTIPDLHLRRFTIAGALISDTRFAGLDLTASRALSDNAPIWTGTGYLTPAVRETGTRTDSYLLRYCPLLAEIAAPRVVEVGQPVVITGIAEGGVPDYDYDWTITRDPGGSDEGETITRTFGITGTRVVTLVVTDETGESTTATFSIEVVEEIEPPPPPAKPRRRAARK